MARQMKESGVSWIGQIPQSWEVVRTKNCYTHKKQVVGEDADNFERLALTLNGVIKRPKDDATGLQPEAFNSYQILRENELVFKLIDLANVATSRVGYSPYEGIVSPAYIILNPNKYDESRFGEYYFLSMWQREVFNHMGDDGVRSSLNAGDLLNIPYLLAPSHEKEKIVKFLDKKCAEIDSVVSKTKTSIDEYKSLKRVLITETVTKGVSKCHSTKDSGIEWIGLIPSHWNVKRFKAFAKTIKGKSIDVLTEPTEESVKVLSVEALRQDEAQFYDYVHVDDDKQLCTPNDIVVIWDGAGVGEFLKAKDGALSSTIAKIQLTNKSIILPYLWYWRYKIEYRLKSIPTGMGIPHLNPTLLNNFMIAVPPVEEQQAIAEYLDKKTAEIDNNISLIEQKISTYKRLKQSLIDEVVTGKRKIN